MFCLQIATYVLLNCKCCALFKFILYAAKKYATSFLFDELPWLGTGIETNASGIGIPASQSGSGAIRYRTGSPYSGTGLLPASTFKCNPIPD
jgi:hypothetical protein